MSTCYVPELSSPNIMLSFPGRSVIDFMELKSESLTRTLLNGDHNLCTDSAADRLSFSQLTTLVVRYKQLSLIGTMRTSWRMGAGGAYWWVGLGPPQAGGEPPPYALRDRVPIWHITCLGSSHGISTCPVYHTWCCALSALHHMLHASSRRPVASACARLRRLPHETSELLDFLLWSRNAWSFFLHGIWVWKTETWNSVLHHWTLLCFEQGASLSDPRILFL